jgi:hypothetical protein
VARLLGAIGDPIHAEPWIWMDESPEGHECSFRCGKDRHLVALEPFDRTPRQLLAYCGHGDPAAKRRKGMDQADTLALGNPVAKMLLHLLAESCVKQIGSAGTTTESDVVTGAGLCATGGGTDDPVILTDDAAANAATAVTRAPRRRSPYRDAYDQAKAKYEAREEWTQAHKHNAALRFTAKQIGIDLWRVASGLPPRWKSEEGL